MAFKSPPEIYESTIEVGAAKAAAPFGKSLVAGALAGAFIAFGALFAIAVTSGMDPGTWGTLPQLFAGACFSFGLMLVLIAGAELVTGAVPAVVLAAGKRRASWSRVGAYLALTTLGAFLGSLLVAYFLGVKSGVLTGPEQLERLGAIATLKARTETDWQIFLRGIGCNWLVCLAVWMALAADGVGGKIAAIFFPVTAFVAMGFDHLVANMFFLPAAHFAGVPGIEWANILNNLLYAGLGNLVGALVFVCCAYWYLYGRRSEGVAAETVPAPRAPAPVEPRPEPAPARG
ncbi:MAG TPA: formate/nitrite transporter family protein [Solirubrobacterales bacterium]|nr:formate/nitrite transporter family protein [Solirubrobacterales bacterium]